MNTQKLKKEVFSYWNQASCGTEYTDKTKFSKAYFEEIEQLRYTVEPEIFSFAQFSRYKDKKILEVGIGAGTDFLQWVRSGAYAYGIDLTDEAIQNVSERLSLYHLQAREIQVADAEAIPYEDNYFDLVYSWGVIHHSPDTEKCLKEIIRVTRPGGTIKIMVYNRHSLFACYRYVLAALLKGKPFQSLKTILYNYQESIGTKAYTIREIRKMVALYPVHIINIKATVTQHDLLYYKSKFVQLLAYLAACIGGWRQVGWFMTIELKKQ